MNPLFRSEVIIARFLNHPALTLGYRLEMGGVRVVYACDHEPHSRNPGQSSGHELDQRHREFLADAELAIHDAQFTDKEYAANRKGWGHSTVEYACEMGQLARVKQMAFTHHDPGRMDDALDELVASIRRDLMEKKSSLQVFAAADGQVVELEIPSPTATIISDGNSSSIPAAAPAVKDLSLLLGISDAGLSLVLTEAARTEDVRIYHAQDSESAVAMAKYAPPGLILLEDRPPRFDGLNVCRILRLEQDWRLKGVPIVMVSDRENTRAGFVYGITQWLIAPFSTQYARAQIQAWLLRSACRWIRPALPADEDQRLAVLRGLSILDTKPDERFDSITRLAAAVGEVPIVLVSLVDQNRQWFKSCFGLAVQETSREVSFCAHAVMSRTPLIVQDTLLDDRFADNPLVVGEPRIRFYAGYPIFHSSGSCLGTLCMIDTRPRQFSAATIQRFEELANRVQQEINSSPREASA